MAARQFQGKLDLGLIMGGFMRLNHQVAIVAAVASCALAACARTEAPPGTPILETVKLAGGDCLGPGALPVGWKLNAQTLDENNPTRPLSLFLLRAPEGRFKSFTKRYTLHDGLIEAQVRDTSDIPYFGGAAGKRSYEDVIRETFTNGQGERRTEPGGDLTLTALRMGKDAELIVASDPPQTLLICNPPGGDEEPECKVTTDFLDGRYKIITAFTYDHRAQFRQMVAQAEAMMRKALVACP